MDFVITAVRIPLAVIALVVIVSQHIIGFFLETIAVAICLPIAVAEWDRQTLKTSWIAKYPHLVRHGLPMPGSFDTSYNDDDLLGCLLFFAIVPFVLVWVIVHLIFLPKKGLERTVEDLIRWTFAD